jgi:hypothetical protein
VVEFSPRLVASDRSNAGGPARCAARLSESRPDACGLPTVRGRLGRCSPTPSTATLSTHNVLGTGAFMSLDLEALETSFDLVAPRSDELMDEFYARLFAAAPSVRRCSRRT